MIDESYLYDLTDFKKKRVDMTVSKLIYDFGFVKALEMVSYWESIDVVSPKYADQLKTEILLRRKSQRKQFTKYRKFHPYQSKVIE